MSDLPKMLSKREIELEELEEAKYVQSLRDDIEKLQEQLNTAKKALINIKLRTERDELETYYVERNHDIRKDAIRSEERRVGKECRL